MTEDAVRAYIESLRKDGLPIPEELIELRSSPATAAAQIATHGRALRLMPPSA